MTILLISCVVNDRKSLIWRVIHEQFLSHLPVATHGVHGGDAEDSAVDATQPSMAHTAPDTTAARELHYHSDEKRDILQEMLRNLRQLPWERVDICFKEYLSVLLAHEAMVVKFPRLHTRGVDVVQHIVDHFDPV